MYKIHLIIFSLSRNSFSFVKFSTTPSPYELEETRLWMSHEVYTICDTICDPYKSNYNYSVSGTEVIQMLNQCNQPVFYVFQFVMIQST